MDFVYVIVTVGGMIEELFRFTREEVYQAEDCFVDCCSRRLSNFDEYTQADIEDCVEDGYEGFGNGNSVQLFWSDN